MVSIYGVYARRIAPTQIETPVWIPNAILINDSVRVSNLEPVAALYPCTTDGESHLVGQSGIIVHADLLFRIVT